MQGTDTHTLLVADADYAAALILKQAFREGGPNVEHCTELASLLRALDEQDAEAIFLAESLAIEEPDFVRRVVQRFPDVPLVVMVAEPPVENALKSIAPPALLLIVALPAVGASVPNGVPKKMVPKLLLLIVAVPAVLLSAKPTKPLLLLMVEASALVLLKKLNSPLLSKVALPAAL